jgi:hypothetical protein
MQELTYIINKLNEWIVVFVGLSCIFLLGLLIFKGLTARHLYKSFGIKGLRNVSWSERRFILAVSARRCQNTHKDVFRYQRWFFQILLFQVLTFIFFVCFLSVETYPVFSNIFLCEFDTFVCDTSAAVLVWCVSCYQHLTVLVSVPE